jgi:tRNA U34 2-thiouridine synthase MnmA/TrmU
LLPNEQFAVSRLCGSLQKATHPAAAAAAEEEAVLQQEAIREASSAAEAQMRNARPAAAVAVAAVQHQGSYQQGLWVAELCEPLRGITPGQMFVLYDGEVCLGSAMIAAHGLTMAEQ